MDIFKYVQIKKKKINTTAAQRNCKILPGNRGKSKTIWLHLLQQEPCVLLVIVTSKLQLEDDQNMVNWLLQSGTTSFHRVTSSLIIEAIQFKAANWKAFYFSATNKSIKTGHFISTRYFALWRTAEISDG